MARIVAALDAVFSYGFKPEMGYERGIVSAADAYDEAAGEFGMEGRAFFFQQRRRSSRLSVSGGATPNHPGRRSSGGSGGGSLRSPTMRERGPSVVAGDDERGDGGTYYNTIMTQSLEQAEMRDYFASPTPANGNRAAAAGPVRRPWR